MTAMTRPNDDAGLSLRRVISRAGLRNRPVPAHDLWEIAGDLWIGFGQGYRSFPLVTSESGRSPLCFYALVKVSNLLSAGRHLLFYPRASRSLQSHLKGFARRRADRRGGNDCAPSGFCQLAVKACNDRVTLVSIHKRNNHPDQRPRRLARYRPKEISMSVPRTIETVRRPYESLQAAC